MSLRTKNGIWSAMCPAGHVADFWRGLMTNREEEYPVRLSDVQCAQRVRDVTSSMGLRAKGRQSTRCLSGKDRSRSRMMIQRLYLEYDQLRAQGAGNHVGALTHTEFMKAFCSLQCSSGVADMLHRAHAEAVPPFAEMYLYAARTFWKTGLLAPLLGVWRLSLLACDEICHRLPTVVLRALAEKGRHADARTLLAVLAKYPPWRATPQSLQAELIVCDTPENAWALLRSFPRRIPPHVLGAFVEICRKGKNAAVLEECLSAKRYLLEDVSAVTLTHIMTVYCAVRDVDKVLFFFRKIAEPDEVAHYAVIDVYTATGNYPAAMTVYSQAAMRFQFLSYRCRYAGLRAALLAGDAAFAEAVVRDMVAPLYNQPVHNVLPMLQNDGLTLPAPLELIVNEAVAKASSS
eukprot:TRINITY_DN29724_c0_g1_i1.p1 TRINITY_DN29724_c0_g1~~TRINITY_DN29724_c0_g1_i1.p1  ORF type:complete len:404 (+),score=43.66 TRINITY_DN29724_c0_g1_i1:85-1296(+)